jgi:hypothetical protein
VATDWEALQTFMWVALLGFLSKKILQNLSEIGLPLPDNIPVVDPLMNTIGRAPKALIKKK